MRYLICYDIADDRKRRRIAKYLEANSIRIQGSVFLGVFTKQRYMEVRNQLIDFADIDEEDSSDSVYMCPLCDQCWNKRWHIGNGRELEFGEVIVV
ncbi:CRISPR-associated endonuclease Cas2 [Anaerovibrio sp. RM50]|uniref:CRISPR-associated endonuclease Cas2 n=1 Tax=Anaerovibrio sp. RM50 TaxID=1200557 RepID=UPI00056827EC|nr:CRISPR-associated endonuclease Cas2 [Anaerovibrio sp. RM50]